MGIGNIGPSRFMLSGSHAPCVGIGIRRPVIFGYCSATRDHLLLYWKRGKPMQMTVNGKGDSRW